MSAKPSKLEKARKAAIIPETEERPEVREFGSEDILKQFIRTNYWKNRIKSLKRDIKPELDNGVKYFSLCSKYAFDIRFFVNERFINTNNDKKKFYFCEYKREDYNFLKKYFIDKRFTDGGKGFYGKLADIAIKSDENDYGRFWGAFPFDIINLDYYGDIFKINPQEVGIDDFQAIKSIIYQQSRLRRQYELWITFRAKEARTAPKVEQTFKELIKENRQNHKKTFGKEYSEHFGTRNISSLKIEEICYIGILKWLWWACYRSCSSIVKDKLEILKYIRIDKDKKEYNLYNILLRIIPYDDIEIPSPVSRGSKWSEDRYIKGISSCFKNPIDVDEKFKKLSDENKEKLKTDLEDLNRDFEEDKKGYLV